MRSEGYCSCRVCVCVCLLSHISLLERLFVLKTLSRTQRETKVKQFVGFSLKPLRCRDPALPPLYGHAYSRPFFSCTRMRISRVYTRMIHRRGFSTLVLFIGSVCVCLSVCLLSHISPMERLFVLKTLSRTQRATKVKKFVGFSLKPLRCRDPALPPLYGHAYSRPFFSCTRMRISRVYTRMIHRRGFSTLVLFILFLVFRDLAIAAGAGFFSLSRSETTSLCSCWASSSDSELLLLWSFVGVYIPEPQLYELGALVPVLELAAIFTPARDVTPFIPSILPIIPALCPSSRAPYYSHFYASIFGASLELGQWVYMYALTCMY